MNALFGGSLSIPPRPKASQKREEESRSRFCRKDLGSFWLSWVLWGGRDRADLLSGAVPLDERFQPLT